MIEIGLIGAGNGHYEFIDLAKACGYTVACVYDDSAHRTDLEYIIVENRIRPELAYTFSIGDPKIKKLLNDKLKPKLLKTLIHPNTYIGKRTEIGKGTAVQMGSKISNDSHIGDNVFLNFGAAATHNSNVGDYCFIGPNATILAKTRVGEGVFIGAHAVILGGLEVGEWSIVGAGSIVTKNVEPYTVVVGNPAKFLRKI